MKIDQFAAAAVLALVLALGLTARIFSQHRAFERVVNESLATSEGYDQQFISLVNHLEDVLTTRASFPFLGGRDPMTGRRREVAAMPGPTLALSPAAAPAPARTASAKSAARLAAKLAAKSAAKPVAKPDTIVAEPPLDKVRLTAIIADDYGQHTAIVMDGERSLSVDVGDMVGSRRVLRITSKELAMEDDATVYTYGLTGSRIQQRK